MCPIFCHFSSQSEFSLNLSSHFKHTVKLQAENYYVVPIAQETMGSWAPDSLKFMKDLGSRVSEATGEKRAKSFLFQSMSMNLQRGNALCVMGTVAHHRKLEEIYNLGTIQTQEQEG